MLLKYTQGKIVIKTFLFSFPVLATLWNGIGLFWHLSLLFKKIIITFVALISRYITVPLIIIKVSVKRPTKLQRLATIQGLYDDRSGILFLYDRAQKRIEEKRKILSLRMKKKNLRHFHYLFPRFPSFLITYANKYLIYSSFSDYI